MGVFWCFKLHLMDLMRNVTIRYFYNLRVLHFVVVLVLKAVIFREKWFMMPLDIALLTYTTDAKYFALNITASICRRHCQHTQKLPWFSKGLSMKACGKISWPYCHHMLHYARRCYSICCTNGHSIILCWVIEMKLISVCQVLSGIIGLRMCEPPLISDPCQSFVCGPGAC